MGSKKIGKSSLEEISIRSLGVIESSNIEFKSGLTVLTGETGADMSPEVRETSEKVVVAAVIVGQIATQSAVAAAASAASTTYRRKP